MYKQLIIVRKDLNMSVGKLAGQVAHASNAFLISLIKSNSYNLEYKRLSLYEKQRGENGEAIPVEFKLPSIEKAAEQARLEGKEFLECPTGYKGYEVSPFVIEKELYEEWLDGIYTKIICGAKSKQALLKSVSAAEGLGLKENEDFFLIRDHCLTELTPEETDNEGNGVTLTAIGFRPLPAEISSQISKKYQLL